MSAKKSRMGPQLMRRFDLYISQHQFSTLERLARSTGLNKAELIRRAIDLYLEVRAHTVPNEQKK